MSRPRKTSDTLATRQIIFRLSEPEYAQLEAVAARAGLRVNELARRLTRRGQHRLVVQTTRRHDPAFLAGLKAIGNNINQITTRFHLTGRVSSKMESLCDEIRRMMLSAVDEEDHG